MPEVAPLLKVRGLVKSYAGRNVVDHLDLTCQAGMVLGLLGPNGAGKSTTLRMLYGFVEPDSGSIDYQGLAFADNRTLHKGIIGVCQQDDSLDYDFPVEENLLVQASYFRPHIGDVRTRVTELLQQFDLTQFAKLSPHALSGGYKRRLMIARSLVHNPKILFLDEPTTGLDPAARIEVWRMIALLRQQGLGIILTTHYMDEAERLTDEIVILSKGKAVAQGTARSLLGSIMGEHVAVLPLDAIDATALLDFARAHLATQPNKVVDEWQVPLTAKELAEISVAFSHVRFVVREPTLDDLFLKLALEN